MTTIHLPAVFLLAAWVGTLACGAIEASDSSDPADSTDAGDSGDSGLVCLQTLTRTRCAVPCRAREQTFSRPSADRKDCGGNRATGCLVEHATGDFYRSATTSYFAEVTEKFRVCTREEVDEGYAYAQADGG